MKIKLLAIIFVVFITWSILAQQSQMFDNRPTISVNGEAVVKVQPDEISITFGIETWDKNVMVAKQENNEIMKRAVTAIKEAGIEDNDIQTDYL